MLRASVALALGISLYVMPAMAGEQDFKLVNKTGYQIDEVYVGPVTSDNWGSDIMGSGALGVDEAADIKFDAPPNVCKWDMKVKYNDGDTAEWRSLNLCSINTVTLYWNKSAGTTRAVTE